MTVRFYVMPMVQVMAPGPTNLPKYLPYSHGGPATGGPFPVTGSPLDPDPALSGVTMSKRHVVDQGLGQACFCALDVTPAEHSALVAYVSNDPAIAVDGIPANLDNTINGNLAAARADMRKWGIPGNWMATSTTWRQVARGIFAVFQIGQALEQGGDTRLFPQGVTLDTTVGALDAGYRSSLFAAMDSHGYDRSAIADLSTMEDVMEVLTTQAAPDAMLGVVL